MRVVSAGPYYEPRDAISHDWIHLLDENRWEPVLIPNSLGNPIGLVEHACVDAILLTNGEDVNPSLYNGEVSSTSKYSDERDSTELALVRWGLEKNRPILCVCRGMQLANVYFGGSIVHEISSDPRDGIQHVGSFHEIEIIDEPTLDFVRMQTANVNSFHRHGITAATLGGGLIPFAKARDGIIEGCYLRGKPLLGIQWHPERPGPRNFCQSGIVLRFLREGPWW